VVRFCKVADADPIGRYPPRYPRIDADSIWIPGRGPSAVTTISEQFAEQPRGRLAPGSGLRVSRSSSRTSVAHLVNARSPPRQGFTHPSRSIFTHWGGVMPRPACRLHRASDGSPPECAVTAQIAHSKYPAQYALLVRIRVRTGSRIARRFALLVRTLLREPGANQAASLLSKAMVSRRRFPLWFPPKEGVLTGNLGK